MKVSTRKGILIALAFVIFGISATVITNDKYFEIVKNIEIYSNVYKELNKNYVEDIDPGELMRTGIDAMVSSLDPFTNYISESQVESYRINRQGRYEGIGILVGSIDNTVTITEVTEGGPAHSAGIKAADQIIAINDILVEGKSQDEVNQIMRGAPGTDIKITVQRPGEKGTISKSVSRDKFDIPNVPVFEILDGDIAYVSLTTFTQDAGKNIQDALKKLKDQNEGKIEGIILDLRNNGGGLLREAIAVSNIFVDQGKQIVTTKGKVRDRDKAYNTLKKPFDLETPVTILINKSSASASEIVSGVIQDYDRGVLLGQRSYGKGLVQNTQEVGYNSRVKLTTSKYYIPSGRCIQSVEYENGEPVDIPDDKRSKFKTTNGRTVLDGGGVTPDIKLIVNDASPFVKSLQKNNIIFKYVTDYCKNHESIADAAEYKFTNYDAFVTFAKASGFVFESKSEQLLKELDAQLKQADLKATTESSVLVLTKVLNEDKEDDYIQFKDEITELIEDDIISRYYFQKGKILNSLNEDKEVLEAISVMRDKARYNKILKG